MISNLAGYGGYGDDCCVGVLGTFALSPWFGGYGGSTFPVPVSELIHRSFGFQSNSNLYAKPDCAAIWLAHCNRESVISDRKVWSLRLFAGDPFAAPGQGSSLAAEVASTRLDAFLRMELLHSSGSGTPVFTRTEQYRVDLPKPCPESGVFTLTPVGTPVINPGSTEEPPACWRSTDFLHSVTIEITAP